MDFQAYQKARIQSYFSLGLTFSVNGDQLAVNGLSQFPADDRQWIQDGIRRHKSEIMAEVTRLQNTLAEVVRQAGDSKGLSLDQINKINEDGSAIMEQLTEKSIQDIFQQ